MKTKQRRAGGCAEVIGGYWSAIAARQTSEWRRLSVKKAREYVISTVISGGRNWRDRIATYGQRHQRKWTGAEPRPLVDARLGPGSTTTRRVRDWRSGLFEVFQ
jgi:hypothetical protein